MHLRRLFWLLWILAAAALYLFINNLGTRVVLLSSIIVPLLSIGVCALASAKLAAEVALPRQCQKGQRLTGLLQIENRSMVPIVQMNCVLKCDNLLTGEKQEQKLWFSIEGKCGTAIPFDLKMTRCGKRRITVGDFRTMDVFGLAAFPLKCEARQELVIVPHGFEMQVKLIEDMLLSLDSETYSMAKAGTDSSETFAIREYVPGDSMKSIHWKLSQKADRLMVRELGLPIVNRVLLLLETSITETETVRADQIDALAEAFVSLSQALLGQDIQHSLGWKDMKTGIYVQYEIAETDHLAAAVGEIMGNTFGNRDTSVADCFLNFHERCSYAHVAVISPCAAADFADLYCGNRLTLLLNSPDGQAAGMQPDGVFVVPFSEKTYKIELNAVEL